ncbi:MAG: DUF2213 domain-containing protein [Candidatus Afipia apatlaquensis]|uniref:DUF2213 domain-containing protein n=1 Tax=Candidatus Afipia apatlaquensis TaxID=2712852 RepID=A0A7C9VLG1_9BRAD|nr:DUF2213 domain-containing protein [Candidatus Afipia apatlaquensis]
MTQLHHAFDRQSARSVDSDGRLRVKNCILSTAEVNPYRGQEIPGWKGLGLNADTVYDLYRDPEALRESIKSFEGVPLMVKHIAQSADEPRKEYIGGSVHGVTFDGKYLRGDLLVWDGYAIDLIESDEQSDLSCSYRYDPVMTSGTKDGNKFDGRMAKIQGNHVALVDEGRASDAHVADAALQPSQHPDPSLQGDTMAFPEKDPSAAPAAAAPAAAAPAAAAPAVPAAAAPGADIGAALKHIATLLETVLTRLPGAAPEAVPAAAAPAAAAAAPGAEDEGGQPSGEVGPENEGKEGPGFTLAPTAKVKGADDEDPELDADGNPVLPPSNQEGTPARGAPTPHVAMDAKGVQAVVAAAVKAERTRAAAVQEARRSVQGVLGDVAMDDAGAIYREALAQVGVDVDKIGKGAERVAWDAYKVAAGAAAGVRPGRHSTAAHAADAAGAAPDNVPSYMKHVDKISVRG